jgi:hypothetical protein
MPAPLLSDMCLDLERLAARISRVMQRDRSSRFLTLLEVESMHPVRLLVEFLWRKKSDVKIHDLASLVVFLLTEIDPGEVN